MAVYPDPDPVAYPYHRVKQHKAIMKMAYHTYARYVRAIMLWFICFFYLYKKKWFCKIVCYILAYPEMGSVCFNLSPWKPGIEVNSYSQKCRRIVLVFSPFTTNKEPGMSKRLPIPIDFESKKQSSQSGLLLLPWHLSNGDLCHVQGLSSCTYQPCHVMLH